MAVNRHDERLFTAFTEKVKDNKKVWDIYANGFTQCVNQCEQPKSTAKSNFSIDFFLASSYTLRAFTTAL